jgi:hypothetical protein
LTDPYELIDCYEAYESEAKAAGDPINLYSFVAYAQRPLGIDNRWWARNSRGDANACKVHGLREAIAAIESCVAGHLASGGLKASVHAGMAAQMLKTMEDREQLSAEKEARAKLQQEQAEPETPPEQIANFVHPDMTPECYDKCIAAGVQPPLYSQQQLEAGFPLFLPELSDE